MNSRFLTWKEALVLAAAALGLLAWLFWPKAEGRVAVVERSGEEVGRYALDTPVRVPVSGANGFSLTVVIKDGAACVEHATCPDLLCQRHAPVSKAGQAIICLPGQVSVRVEGGEGHGPDAVAG